MLSIVQCVLSCDIFVLEVGWDRVCVVRRSLLGLFYHCRWPCSVTGIRTDRIIESAPKRHVSIPPCSQMTSWNLSFNPGRRNGNPSTNRLSNCTPLILLQLKASDGLTLHARSSVTRNGPQRHEREDEEDKNQIPFRCFSHTDQVRIT
jgi:hypothetical protein